MDRLNHTHCLRHSACVKDNLYKPFSAGCKFCLTAFKHLEVGDSLSRKFVATNIFDWFEKIRRCRKVSKQLLGTVWGDTEHTEKMVQVCNLLKKKHQFLYDINPTANQSLRPHIPPSPPGKTSLQSSVNVL